MANSLETEDQRRIEAEHRLAGQIYNIVDKISPQTKVLSKVRDLMDQGAAHEARQALITPVIDNPIRFIEKCGSYHNLASHLPILIEQLQELENYQEGNQEVSAKYARAREIFTAYSLHRQG